MEGSLHGQWQMRGDKADPSKDKLGSQRPRDVLREQSL